MATQSKVWLYVLLDWATAITTGAPSTNFRDVKRKYQGIMTGSGTISANVEIEVSLDGLNWLSLGTITMSGTDTATDGFAGAEPWPFTRARLTTIQGTNAKVRVYTNM